MIARWRARRARTRAIRRTLSHYSADPYREALHLAAERRRRP